MSLLELLSELGEDGLLNCFRQAVDVEALPPEILRELREGALKARKLPVWGEDGKIDVVLLRAWQLTEEKAFAAMYQRLVWKQQIREANRRKKGGTIKEEQ